MNWLDYTILGIVAFSALISVIRGFVREAVSLVVWVAAFWIALRYGPALAEAMSGMITTVSARMVVAFVALFLAVFALGALVNYLLSKVVKRVGLGGADRILGVMFGVARGALAVALVLVVVGLTPLTDSAAWRESLVVGYVSPWLAHWQHWLPGEVQASWLRV